MVTKTKETVLKKGNDLYFKTLEKYYEYRGIRYFRMLVQDGLVIQVTSHPGEVKKGRGNASIGINVITKITFMSNYLLGEYVESCSKAEYNKAFDKLFNALK